MPSTYTFKKFTDLFMSCFAHWVEERRREEKRGMERIPFINIILSSAKNLVKLLMILLLLGFGMGLFHQFLKVMSLMDLLSL